jgi:hypothetical protein
LVLVAVMFFFVQESVFAGADGSSPYAGIMERNIFGLKTPPAPQAAALKSPELPRVNLSGFATIGNQRRAFLVIHPMDSEAPGGSRNRSPDYLSLAEGEKGGAVELVRIDEAEELVEILNAGIPMTLTLKANGNASGGNAGRGQTASLSGAQAIGTLPRSATPIATPFHRQAAGGNYAGSGPIIVGGARGGAASAGNQGRPTGGAVNDASQPSYQDTVANGPSALSYSDDAATSAAPPAQRNRTQNPRVFAVTKYGYPPDLQ